MVAPDTPVVRFRWERLLSMPCDINPIVIAVLPWEPKNQQQQQHQLQVENQQINQSNTVEQNKHSYLQHPSHRLINHHNVSRNFLPYTVRSAPRNLKKNRIVEKDKSVQNRMVNINVKNTNIHFSNLDQHTPINVPPPPSDTMERLVLNVRLPVFNRAR